MKLKSLKNKEFDFSMYGKEDVKIDQNRSKVNIFRSKFSPYADNFRLLSDIKLKMKELGVKVGADSINIKELRDFLSTIEQLFQMFSSLLGEYTYKKINDKIKEYKKELRQCDIKGEINEDINDRLIELENEVETMLDYLNLGFDKEKIYSEEKKAENMIVQ